MPLSRLLPTRLERNQYPSRYYILLGMPAQNYNTVMVLSPGKRYYVVLREVFSPLLLLLKAKDTRFSRVRASSSLRIRHPHYLFFDAFDHCGSVLFHHAVQTDSSTRSCLRAFLLARLAASNARASLQRMLPSTATRTHAAAIDHGHGAVVRCGRAAAMLIFNTNTRTVHFAPHHHGTTHHSHSHANN
jgi:hypothetical protein